MKGRLLAMLLLLPGFGFASDMPTIQIGSCPWLLPKGANINITSGGGLIIVSVKHFPGRGIGISISGNKKEDYFCDADGKVVGNLCLVGEGSDSFEFVDKLGYWRVAFKNFLFDEIKSLLVEDLCY